MRKVEQAEFEDIADAHQRWLLSSEDGRRANFSGRHLHSIDSANRDLQGALFDGAKIELSEFESFSLAYADFTNAQFDASHFTFCDLTATNFRQSQWVGCGLTTTQALSDGSFLVSETKLANFRGATFANVAWVGEFCQLQFDGAKFHNVVAEAAHYSKCDFGHAVLKDGRFSQSSFTDCWFGQCSISDCDFSRAEIRGCNFERGVLEKLAFIEADLLQNDLRQARLADLCFARGHFMNLNNQELINELDEADLDDGRYLGASFYFTGGPLPGRAEIEWSDNLEQNLWVVRC